MARTEDSNQNLSTLMSTPETVLDLHPGQHLSIPAGAALILPDRDLSVPGLLHYKLPNPLRTVFHSEVSPWSASCAGVINLVTLGSHIIPPKASLDQLLSQLPHLNPTIQSIQRATILPENALPERLPLWILWFWQETYEAHQGRSQWKACKDWVASKPSVNASLQDQLERTLINVHWQGSLDGWRHD
jgi:hypothetical protein